MASVQLLTHSRSQSFKTCRKQSWYAYENGIRPIVDGRALRMGSAYHAGLEAWANTHDLDQAVNAARDCYFVPPENCDEREWALECETVVRLVCGYTWRWEQCPIEHIAAELKCELPLINPKTGKASKLFRLAGKIDGIVKLEDGRTAVLEHKLLGDDISADSELWRRVTRMDPQITLYVYFARKMGYDVTTVLYDVARKPTIKPQWVSICDSDGEPIVLDAHGERVKAGNKWRKTGDKDKGYVLQERECSIDEWGERLNADIGTRPDFYYQRVEVPRMDGDIDALLDELWDIQQTIRDAQTKDRWYRTVTKNTCQFCSYVGLCERNHDPAKDDLPSTFVRLKNLHPELELTHASAPDGPAETVTATTADGQQYEPYDQPF